MLPGPDVPPWGLAAAAVAGLAAGVPLTLLAAGALRPPRRPGVGLVLGGAVLAAVVAVVLVLRLGGSPLLVPYLLLGAGCTALTLVDAVERRLPNSMILLVSAVFTFSLLVAAAGSGRLVPFAWGTLGALAMLLVYLAMAVASRGAIGMGDVKLAAVIGLACGFLGLGPWLVGLVAAFLVNAVVVLVALALRRTTLRSSFPFGPAMVAGLLIAVLTA